jgi:hypothetical protein
MLKRRFMQPLVAVVVLVSLFCQGTWALAGTTGSLSGTVTVTQANGTTAPLANARVAVVSPSQSVSTMTDGGGHFNFLSLSPDTYTVSVEKTGFESVSLAGVNVFADSNQSLALATKPALREIGRVSSRSPSALVKPGTTSDVYSITPGQQDKVAAAGGGGTLNSAWSAIATVPGVFVAPNQAGYIGAGPSLSIRGGDYDQIGYEVDGVPVNRAFDNYPSGPVSSLGQQELQVYTGVPPANAQANGLSGFINQVIRTGSYPGFATGDLGIGGPTFYHKASFEIGGATPSRSFSYYLGLGGYNQDYRTADQYNGASLSNLYGTPLAFCDPSLSIQVAPSCYTGGKYNGNTAQLADALGVGPNNGSFYLGPFNADSIAQVVDRDSVANLHFAIPHKNGLKDDIQLLGMINYVQNTFYTSTNDQGGVPLLSQIDTFGVPYYIDGYGYKSPTGVPLQSNYQSLAEQYQFPNVAPHPFDGQIPPAEREGFLNDQAIYKLQYTHNFSSSALFKVYGYTYYSDWLNTGPQGAYADFVACCPADYELSSHTRGVSGSFLDQLDSKNLLNLTAAYTTASTVRDNNTQIYNGFYGADSVNARTVLATTVDSTNPTNGLCYPAGGGAATTCKVGGPAGFATLQQAYNGTITPATGTCGGGPCEYFVVENGNYATYNTVKPTYVSGSLTDEFHPSSKLTINGGIRFDNFGYQGGDTSGTSARTLFYNAFNMDTCQDSNNNLYDKVTQLGGSVSAKCSSFTGPNGKPLTSVNVTNPSGLVTESSSEFQPRIGATYTLDPFTVLRASYGRYAQGPNSAFVQYDAQQQNAPNLLYNTYSFQKFGFTSPDHDVQPEVSNNFDFSVEHQFKGGIAVKLTPFLRTTQGQIQQFFLNQQTGFVSGLNVGKQTSEGAEFEVDKGDFSQQGLTARATFTYTNSYINYNTLSNGSSVITPLNTGIAQYNAYTKSCAPGGHLAGTANCGTTESGAAAAPCYTVTGAADNSCAPGSIANPYWNAPAQGLLNPNGNYSTYDILTAGIGSAVNGYGAPYVGSLVLNYRINKFSIAPIVQMYGGQRYGAPASTEGIAPDACAAGLASSVSGDPRYPYGAPGGSPFDANSCGTLAQGIPDPYTKGFDGIGAFVAPSQLQLHMQMTYDVSRSVSLVANVTNLINTCFGGTTVKWAVSGACGYGVVGGGITGDVGNLYNPGAVIQPYVNTPYEPTFSGFPFGVYLNAKIKL